MTFSVGRPKFLRPSSLSRVKYSKVSYLQIYRCMRERASTMAVNQTLGTVSPSTGEVILQRTPPSHDDLRELTQKAQAAFKTYRKTSLSDRQKVVKKALGIILERKDELAREITEQMGRPISYTAKEITTAVARAEYMLKISDEALKDTPGEPEQGIRRCIKKTPLGVVLVLFAWNVRTRPPSGTIINADERSIPISSS